MTYKEKVNTIKNYDKELKEIRIDEDVGINKNTAQQIVNVGNDVGLIAKVTMFESIQKIKGEIFGRDIGALRQYIGQRRGLGTLRSR